MAIITDMTMMFLSVLGGFLAAKWTDPLFKAKAMRRIKKTENWGVINIVNPDGRTIIRRAVNFTSGILKIGDAVWILDDDRIYLEGNKDVGFSMKKDSKITKLTDGVPTVFVNMKNLKPCGLFEEDIHARPDETGALILSYIANEIKKRVIEFPNNERLMKIGAVCAIVSVLVLLYLTTQTGEILAACKAAASGQIVGTLGTGGTQVIE